MKKNGPNNDTARRRDELSLAVDAWRQTRTSDERLSCQARERILRNLRVAREDEAKAPALASLFLPASRWLSHAAVPVGALALLLVLAVVPSSDVPGPTGPTSLQATKIGNEVVFEIANGGRVHEVYRISGKAAGAAGVPFATTEGSFRDQLDAGHGLVLYRVD